MKSRSNYEHYIKRVIMSSTKNKDIVENFKLLNYLVLILNILNNVDHLKQHRRNFYPTDYCLHVYNVNRVLLTKNSTNHDYSQFSTFNENDNGRH